jgi:hypothetical protein
MSKHAHGSRTVIGGRLCHGFCHGFYGFAGQPFGPHLSRLGPPLSRVLRQPETVQAIDIAALSRVSRMSRLFSHFLYRRAAGVFFYTLHSPNTPPLPHIRDVITRDTRDTRDNIIKTKAYVCHGLSRVSATRDIPFLLGKPTLAALAKRRAPIHPLKAGRPR